MYDVSHHPFSLGQLAYEFPFVQIVQIQVCPVVPFALPYHLMSVAECSVLQSVVVDKGVALLLDECAHLVCLHVQLQQAICLVPALVVFEGQ